MNNQPRQGRQIPSPHEHPHPFPDQAVSAELEFR